MTASCISVRTIGLIVKQGNPQAAQVAQEVATWLAARNALAFTVEHTHTGTNEKLESTADLILTFGGDGTIISVARQMLGTGIPIAGVNFGQVGFLAEIAQEAWQTHLEQILTQPVPITTRMTLQYSIYRNNAVLAQGEVINDAVLTRGNLARLVRLELGVDNTPFFTLRADGIIISTPTGSTGYAGSAGGPLMVPNLNSYIVAAICPFLSSFPPLMLPAEMPFSITVCEGGTELFLTLDGQNMHHLEVGDIVTLQGLPNRFCMANLLKENYFTRLHNAGFIQQAQCK